MPDPYAKKLFGNPKWADVKLICEGREWPGHKTIICSQSAWLDNACTVESQFGTTTIITVILCDANTLERVLQFLYLGEYEDDDKNIILPPIQPTPVRGLIEDAPSRQPSPTRQEVFTGSSSELLIDLDKNEAFDETMTRVCTDLEKFGLSPPVPFSAASISKSWAHFRVYCASEKLEINDLVALSLSKLATQIRGSWMTEGFTELVRSAFDLTGQYGNVTKPCQLIAAECAAHVIPLMDLPTFEKLVENKPRLAYLIIKALIKQIKIDIPDKLLTTTSSYDTTSLLKLLAPGPPAHENLDLEKDVVRVKLPGASPVKSVSKQTSLAEIQEVVQTNLDDLAKLENRIKQLTTRNEELENLAKGQPDASRMEEQARQLSELQARFQELQQSRSTTQAPQSPSPVRKGRGTFNMESASGEASSFPSALNKVEEYELEIKKMKEVNSTLFKAKDKAISQVTSLKYEIQELEEIILRSGGTLAKRAERIPNTTNNNRSTASASAASAELEKEQKQHAAARAHIEALAKQLHANNAGRNTSNTSLLVALKEQKEQLQQSNTSLLVDLKEQKEKLQQSDKMNTKLLGEAVAFQFNEQKLKETIADLQSQLQAKASPTMDVTDEQALELIQKNSVVRAVISKNIKTRVAQEASRLKEEYEKAAPKTNTTGVDAAPSSQKNLIAELEAQIQAGSQAATEFKQSATDKVAALQKSLQQQEAAVVASQAAAEKAGLAQRELQAKLTMTENKLKASSSVLSTSPVTNIRGGGPNQWTAFAQTAISAADGPKTFIDKQREAKLSASISNHTGSTPNSPASRSAANRLGSNRSTPTGAHGKQNLFEDLTNGAKPPARSTAPATMTAQGQQDLELRNTKLNNEVHFLKTQLSQLRLAPAPMTSRHGRPVGSPSDHDAAERLRKYNEALKMAGLDFKACINCSCNFNCAFRGAPEGDGNTLKLVCTKCYEEACRWEL